MGNGCCNSVRSVIPVEWLPTMDELYGIFDTYANIGFYPMMRQLSGDHGARPLKFDPTILQVRWL